MSAIDGYLGDFARRLTWLGRARVGLGLVVLLAALTFTLSAMHVWLVPAGGWIVASRVLIYLALVAGMAILVSRSVSAAAAVMPVEGRIPQLTGRLTTWYDVRQRDVPSPMTPILAGQVEQALAEHPVSRVIPGREIIQVAGPAALIVTLGALAIIMGVGPLPLAAQRLWTGDLISASAPRVTVQPGDLVIPRGTDVVIEASVFGFEPGGITLSALFDGSPEWERVEMLRTSVDMASFVLVGVTEDLDYYAGADGVHSQRFHIRVADLPRVTEVSVDIALPAWTGRPAETRPGGAVRALEGSGVTVSATSERSLAGAYLVVNGDAIDAEMVETTLTGQFPVDAAGSWYVAISHEGIQTAISPSYPIAVADDDAPEVSFVWPGSDRQATSIEEVSLLFEAKDDYGIDRLALHYAVNGDAWSRVALVSADDIDRAMNESGPPERDVSGETLLLLEDMRAPGVARTAKSVVDDSRLSSSSADADADAGEGAGEEESAVGDGLRSLFNGFEGAPVRPLKPGDLITFYAEAEDHGQMVKTSLYFIDVRAFDRTYREVQQGGGGGGGGGLEIAQRQREIITAAWNLMNRPDGAKKDRPRVKDRGGLAQQAFEDQVAVLALLQHTLKDQVQTLIDRANARQLTGADEVGGFLAEMSAAIEDMIPAAAQLDDIALEEAIAPAQRALQHLLAAEATMRDVDVSMANNNAGGRGSSGRSLDELVDLELDPERNRYELPQQAGGAEGEAPTDPNWERLSELAARQERLDERRRAGDDTQASRWQQEQLRRELEEFRDQLEQAASEQQQASSSQSQAASEASEASGAARGEDSREPEGSWRGGSRDQRARVLQRLDRAITSLDDETGDGAGERSLEEAVNELRQAEIGDIERVLTDNTRTIDRMITSQNAAIGQLDELARQMREAHENGDTIPYYNFDMTPLADQKDRMLRELATVQGTLREAADRLAEQRPRVATQLDEAADGVATDRLEGRLSYASALYQAGRPLLAAGYELSAQESLSRLREAVDEARSQLGLGTAPRLSPGEQIRDLRQALANAGARNSSRGVEAVAGRVDSLIAGLGERLDTRLSRENYLPLGTGQDNTAALMKLTRERLDLVEAALLYPATDAVRAQEPRDEARNRGQTARYFTDLARESGPSESSGQ